MTPEILVYRLLESGLLQPGIYEAAPHSLWQLWLEMLPSYPDILSAIASEVTKTMADISVDRLVCSSLALPLGTLVSTQTGLPLVYSRGHGETPVRDLVGAYDVGHPAGLLVNSVNETGIENIIRGGQSVGLEITHVIAVVGAEGLDFSLPVHVILADNDIRRILSTYFTKAHRIVSDT